ncbi:MAG: transposase [Bacteroidota bacterium]
MKEYYRRHLPHINPVSAIYFITFRLINSLPHHLILQLMEEYDKDRELKSLQKIDPAIKSVPESFYRKYFESFDSFLDNQQSGNSWLRQDAVARIVYNAIKYRDNKDYDLICFTIMSNHVHMLIDVRRDVIPSYNSYTVLTTILHSLKRFTAFECNRALHRSGPFWQSESYDHVVKDEAELERIIRYVVYNPVKAGFVKDPKKWKFTYCKYFL